MLNSQAYASMASCPTPFQHPSQAEQLNGIGKGMAMKLEKRMIQHCKDNGLPIPTRVKSKRTLQHTLDCHMDNTFDACMFTV
jgi:crossover junction endonuclease MUS81